MASFQEMNSKPRPQWARYGVAIGCVILGWLAREALTPGVGQTALPFIFFFPAIAVAAWYGGFGAGAFATLLSTAAADWFFIEPAHSFGVRHGGDVLALSSFVVSCLFIVGAIEAIHRARARETAQLRTTLASIGDAVVATDAGGRVVFLNSEAERLTGWSSSEAAGKPLPDVFRIINEKTRKPVENPVEKVLRLGTVVGLANHTLLVAKDGREIPVDDSAAPIRMPGSPLFGVVLVFRDVTEQRKAQQAAARLAAIVAYSGDAILTKNLEGTIRTWNAGAERLFGYRAEEILGQPVTVLFPPERLTEEDHILGRLRESQPSEMLETVRLTKDGKQVPVLVSVSPLKDGYGEVIGASKVIHDMTELFAARHALEQEKELLSTTLGSIGDGVIVTDEQGRVSFLNKEAERLTGWSTQEAQRKPLPEVFHILNEETRLVVENPVEKVLRLGHVVGLANHTLLVAKDGREIPIDDSAAPIREREGPLFGVVLVFRDFSEHKRVEKSLHASVQRATADVQAMTLLHEVGTRCALSGSALDECLEQILETALALTSAEKGNIQLIDESGVLKIATQRGFGEPFLRSFSTVNSEHASACGSALHSTERVIVEDVTESQIFAGQPSLEVLLEAGVRAVQSTPLFSSTGKVLGMISTHFAQPHRPSERELRLMDLLARQAADYLERKQTEEAQARHVRLLDSSFDAMIVRDAQDRITWWNPGAVELYGWTRDEAIGHVTHSLFKTEFPKALDEILADLHQKDRWEGELLHRNKAGGRMAVFSRWTLERDAQGRPVSILETNMDITQRKKAEEALREAHSELRTRALDLEKLVQQRTARLNEMVGDLEAFSYSIVHDMRSPLRAMQSFAQLLAQECGPVSPAAEDYVRRIKSAAGRMDQLIQESFNYSRLMQAQLPCAPTDVGALLHGIIETYPAFQPPHAEVEVARDFPLVHGNESALTQCISNFLGNAAKFVAPGVTPRVRVWAETWDARVRLFFQDNGIGIEKANHERIFHIFQRLDNRYEGTGIGLAIVKKAAQRMGGTVGVESELGKGSTFWLELPKPWVGPHGEVAP